jgi:hypothetical protein
MKSSRLLNLLVSASVVALCASSVSAADASKGAPAKKEAKSYKITGGLQFGYSTDRHAGLAPAVESMAADSFDSVDEDEDSDDSDSVEMDFDDADVFSDLDLDDQDLLDQIDETTDEDGDGNFFDDDAGFEEGDDPRADDDGVAGGDPIGEDGEPIDPADPVDPADPDPVDPVDPAAPVDPVDPAAGDPAPEPIIEAIMLDGSSNIQAATKGKAAKKSPEFIRDDRMTARANFGYTQKIGTWAKEWKTGAQISTASFDTLTKSEATVFGLSTGPVFEIKSWNAQIMPSFLYANVRSDGDYAFNNMGGALAGAFDLSKAWKLGLRYGYDVREFSNDKLDNIGAYSTGASLKYVIEKNQAVTLGLKTRAEATSPAARAKDQTQIALGYQQKWNNGWYVKPAVGYAWIERDAPANKKQPVREDNRATFNLAVGHDFGHGINVEAQYGNMENDVNLPQKDGSNDRFVILTGWKF